VFFFERQAHLTFFLGLAQVKKIIRLEPSPCGDDMTPSTLPSVAGQRLRFGILTLSDRSARGEREDASGPALARLIEAETLRSNSGQVWSVAKQALLPDSESAIRAILTEWADSGEVDVILTTGGTGFSPRDVTPEATRAVIDREAPGLAEAMRTASLKITPHAMLSRIVTGIRKRTLIINLPGSPKGAVENLQVVLPVLPHAVQLLQEDPASETSH
jgi:molybdenum cofactor synthesis domain-containing protein